VPIQPSVFVVAMGAPCSDLEVENGHTPVVDRSLPTRHFFVSRACSGEQDSAVPHSLPNRDEPHLRSRTDPLGSSRSSLSHRGRRVFLGQQIEKRNCRRSLRTDLTKSHGCLETGELAIAFEGVPEFRNG